ncbi:hypothetical protein [Xylophilus sp. GOD-11R]|uniref:hypothetical protein n=1 Tax=Xylophilus sp. GOD-11R TaxID=3089814 RepID=UPI00298D3853|nr:hypothetical protein [Xylophilus sp. GOD-11R]WPB57994.1 hypothetical protein R9X41_04935 [Xylophilus sp. GOD-11R]
MSVPVSHVTGVAWAVDKAGPQQAIKHNHFTLHFLWSKEPDNGRLPSHGGI